MTITQDNMEKIKALVGESNYAEFEILNDFLSNHGIEVHWVKNGHDALAQFSSIQPDLLILDALLPGVPGLKVCKQIRETEVGKNVKTILLSKVYKQFKDQYDSRTTVGVDAYSEKPVDMVSLEKLLDSLLDLKTTGPGIEEEQNLENDDKSKSGLSGFLNKSPFPKVLYLLRKHKRTGALQLKNELINKIVYLQSGHLSFVSSNQSSESLGRYMVQTGIISVADYNHSLERMLATKQQQGQILLEMEVVQPHQLYEALYGHLIEKILSVFSWENGTYNFKGGRLALDSNLTVDIDLLDVITQGIRKFYPLTRLEGYFNDYKNQKIFPIKDSLYASGDIVLKPAQTKLFRLITGRLTLGQIVARSNLSLTDTFQTIYSLILVEVLRFEGDSGLGGRTAAEQESFIKKRRKRRKELRQSAMHSGDLSSGLLSFREDVSRFFDRIDDMNHFELFKVTDDSAYEEIRNSYHNLVSRYHPSEFYSQADDITKAKADGIFRILSEAYEVLSDPKKRSAYKISLAGKVDISVEKLAAYTPDADKFIAGPEAELPEIDEVSTNAEMSDGFISPAEEMDDSENDDEDELDEQAEPLEFTDEDFEALDADFDFGDETTENDAAVDALDPDISWDEKISFEGEFEEEPEGEIQFDPILNSDDIQVEQGKQVTLDMATLVKSELAFQSGEDALTDEDFEYAVEKFNEAIKLNPREAEYYAYLGWSIFRTDTQSEQNIAQCHEKIKKALSINPNLDIAYYYSGMLFSYLKDFESAKINFNKSLKFNPDNENARAALEKLEEG